MLEDLYDLTSRWYSTPTGSSNRSMEKNRKPRNRPILKCHLTFNERAKGKNPIGKGKFCNNGAGTTGYPHGKKGLDLYFTSHTNINPRWIKDLNLKAYTIKLTKKLENIFSNEVGNGFRQDTESNNHKTDKLDFIKSKNVCSSKDIIKKINRHTTNWEKISLKYISDKELV